MGIMGFVCVRIANVTNGGSSGMMLTARQELLYPRVSQAKFRDETSQRGK